MWKAQVERFVQVMDLSHRIPGHDTFRRVMSRLNPEELPQCSISGKGALSQICEGEIVTIGDTTLRHSFDRATSKTAIHIVSVWAKTN